MVIDVALDGNLDVHVSNHGFFTFQRGMHCATSRKSVRPLGNTCFVCHACFLACPTPCGEKVVPIVDDAFDDMESNSRDEPVAPRKPDLKCGVIKIQAKLALATKFGRLRDWLKIAISHCLDQVAAPVNRARTSPCTMHHLCLPIGMPLFQRRTMSLVVPHPQITHSHAPMHVLKA